MFVLTHKYDNDCYWTGDAEVRQIGQSGHYLYDLNQVLVFPTAGAAREWLCLLPNEDKTPNDWVSEQFIEFEKRVIVHYLAQPNELREQMTAETHEYLLDFYVYDTDWRRVRAGEIDPPFKKAKAAEQDLDGQEADPSSENETSTLRQQNQDQQPVADDAQAVPS